MHQQTCQADDDLGSEDSAELMETSEGPTAASSSSWSAATWQAEAWAAEPEEDEHAEFVAYIAGDDKELASAAKAARDALITLEAADVNFLQAKRHFRAVQMARGFQRVDSPGFKGGGKKGKRRKGKGRGKDSKGGKDSFYADERYD